MTWGTYKLPKGSKRAHRKTSAPSTDSAAFLALKSGDRVLVLKGYEKAELRDRLLVWCSGTIGFAPRRQVRFEEAREEAQPAGRLEWDALVSCVLGTELVGVFARSLSSRASERTWAGVAEALRSLGERRYDALRAMLQTEMEAASLDEWLALKSPVARVLCELRDCLSRDYLRRILAMCKGVVSETPVEWMESYRAKPTEDTAARQAHMDVVAQLQDPTMDALCLEVSHELSPRSQDWLGCVVDIETETAEEAIVRRTWNAEVSKRVVNTTRELISRLDSVPLPAPLARLLTLVLDVATAQLRGCTRKRLLGAVLVGNYLAPALASCVETTDPWRRQHLESVATVMQACSRGKRFPLESDMSDVNEFFDEGIAAMDACFERLLLGVEGEEEPTAGAEEQDDDLQGRQLCFVEAVRCTLPRMAERLKHIRLAEHPQMIAFSALVEQVAK